MSKIALFGRPGAGKSTFARLLAEAFEAGGSAVSTVKLAAPLYELQAVIRACAGRPLVDATAQDGQLLNVLGSELRRINPTALTDAFALRVMQAEAAAPGRVLVCDDMRAADVQAVLALGFRLVEVTAPDGVRRTRKAGRGDLSAGDELHPTEAPVTAEPWRRVHNDLGLAELRIRAQALVQELLA